MLTLVAAGCSSDPKFPTGMTPEQHSAQFFPITAGPHAQDCNTCHGAFDTFKQFDCLSCHGHEQAPTNTLHTSVAGYAYASASCYSCHQDGAKVPFDHAGITNSCATCHQQDALFAALPVAGFTHRPMNGNDCSSCHFSTAVWNGGAAPNALVSDPMQNVVVGAKIPTYSGTTITRLTSLIETLPCQMSHASTAVVSAGLSSCINCHSDAATGLYYPGSLHSSLENLGLSQPTACIDCHANTMPTGLVGPTATNPPRTPASGEMKHDAVLWSGGAPTTTAAVPRDCGVCHASPSYVWPATWSSGPLGVTPARFHASLSGAALAQPSSCVDCHANSVPAALLTSANASLPAGLSFDHSTTQAKADCTACHAPGAAFTSWAGGKYHLAGSATPSTCLPCHTGERPASTAGWQSTTYTRSPFDYGTNANGVTHGGGRDCAVCHRGPGTGSWGSTQNWQGGQYAHPAATTTTCMTCHASQRPDLQSWTTPPAMAALLGFDHSLNGVGDCFGCHQATIAAGRYVNYLNPSTSTLPGGDWQGAISYPGSDLVGSPNQFITAVETALQRSGTNNLVTGLTSTTVTLYNEMLHTSAALPSQLNAGPTNSPNFTKCWHCHTNTNGTVTSYKDGRFHASLTNYSATPGGTVTPLPQPTTLCTDCHTQMRPDDIVEKAASDLQPMDHGTVLPMECATCHHSPGNTWADGAYHANIGATVPPDCTTCHYPLMADAPKSDLTSTTRYAMRHASGQITFQNCQTCHTGALAKGTTTPLASTLWTGGAYHSKLSAQPAACADCHSVSDPAPNVSTQSTATYAFAKGGTTTNGAQWHNHGSTWVAGRDCATCHAADAKTTGSAWSKSTVFHRAGTTATSCKECHGLTNGGGSVMGTNNNLPSGLTDSTTVTSASSSTGVPAGTLDQIIHSDINVSGRDCNFCHTQVGTSTVAGIQGQEWAQAKFHANFNAANPLIINDTTGRCSNCHLNVKPTAVFTAEDHSAFTSASGTTDCGTCHSYPGTGTSTSPNWLGAAGGVPAYVSVGGFNIAQPPATTLIVQAGIASLPHPTVGTLACTACHLTSSGGKPVTAYDHASTLIASNCASCHEAGSDLVRTPWNGSTSRTSGAGDTRPFTIVGTVASYKGNSYTLTNSYNHFFRVDCKECHLNPTGLVGTTTGTTYTTNWRFIHTTTKMTNPTTCNMCHGSPNNIPN